MTIEKWLSNYIDDTGRKRSWLLAAVNEKNPAINMSAATLHRTLKGEREFTAREFFAVCSALDLNPGFAYESAATV